MRMRLKYAIVIISGLLVAGLTLAITKKKNKNGNDVDETLMFVIDKSGSMYSQLPSIKSAIAQTAGSLRGNYRAGMMAFDGCGGDRIFYPQSPGVPLGRRTGRKIITAVEGLRASGSTALALALERVQQIMEAEHICPQVIIFTDNADTCGGKASEIRDRFKKDREKYCLTLDIISSSQDDDVLRDLEDLADSLDGNLYLGDDTEDYIRAIERIRQRNRKGAGRVKDPDDPGGKDKDKDRDRDKEKEEKEKEREKERERKKTRR